MNKEVAKKLIDVLMENGGLNFISLYGGLAQTLTTTEAGSTEEKKLTRRIPVTEYAITEKACDIEETLYNLVLDSSEKGILYFEDNGTVIENERRLAGKFTAYKSNIDLVCWLNRKELTGIENDLICQKAISDIVQKLSIKNTNKECFISLSVAVTNIKPQTPAIFAKYSYDEKVTQYLQQPFEYFSIGLEVRYFLNPKCIDKLTLNPSLC